MSPTSCEARAVTKSAEGVRMAAGHRAVMAEIFVRNEAVLDHFESSRALYLRQAAADGWSPGLDRFALSVPCVIAASDTAARKLAADALHYQHTCLTGSFEARKHELADQYYKESAPVRRQGAGRHPHLGRGNTAGA